MAPIIVIIAVFVFIFGGAYYLDYVRNENMRNQNEKPRNINQTRSYQSKKEDPDVEKFKSDAPSKSEFQSFEDYDDFFEVDDDFFDDYSKDLKDDK